MDKLILPAFFLLFFIVFFLILDSRHGYLKRLGEKLNAGPNRQFWNRAARTFRLISGLYAASLFFASLVINLCTWFSTALGQYAHTLMLLHLLVLGACFICFGFSQQRRLPTDKKNYLRGMPKWANVTLNILFIYVFVLLALQFVHHHGGYSTTERDGKHFIKADGQPEWEMGTEEYWQQECEDLRFFSGFWMGFSFAAAAYLLLAKDKLTEQEQEVFQTS